MEPLAQLIQEQDPLRRQHHRVLLVGEGNVLPPTAQPHLGRRPPRQQVDPMPNDRGAALGVRQDDPEVGQAGVWRRIRVGIGNIARFHFRPRGNIREADVVVYRRRHEKVARQVQPLQRAL